LKALMAGMDGYICWPLAERMERCSHEVGGSDPLLRRGWVKEIGSRGAAPSRSVCERIRAFEKFRPDAVVYPGQERVSE
jgi:nucleoside-diphosphate-sugar epimerase